eukprot:TRINITY_DN8387_c0_g1_i4.p1 TRINITY_DN8387_c0_g1~~TRINITY_DN8387_c0_g1_i4.p1  ORF type:complete len:498 (+),score=99.22 TRINITY_DN8387_c0_g1_i4:73-1566(+)
MRALRVPRRCGVAATVSQRRTAEALEDVDPELRELALKYGRRPPTGFHTPPPEFMTYVRSFDQRSSVTRLLQHRHAPPAEGVLWLVTKTAKSPLSDRQVSAFIRAKKHEMWDGKVSLSHAARVIAHIFVDCVEAGHEVGPLSHDAAMFAMWACCDLAQVGRLFRRFCAWHQRQKWLADRWGCAADDGPNASHWTLALRAATISCEETGRRRDATKADSQKLLDSLGRLCASAESTESIWQGTAEASAGLARALMQGLATVEDFKAAYRLLRRASRRGFATPLVWESFVLLVAKVGGPVDLWLDRMRRSRTPIGVRVVNGALRGWVAAGREPEFDVLQRLQVEGLRPDHFTVSLLLSMYSRAARPDDAQRIADAARQWRPPVQLSRAGLTMLIGAHAPACKAPGDRHHRLATQALDEMRERKLFVQLPRERALSGMRWYAECLASAGAVREFETFCDEIHTLHEQLMVSAQHGRGSQVSSLGVSVTSLSNALPPLPPG